MITISERRIKHCLEILNGRQDEKGVVKERLERLSFELMHLLEETEEFSRVVYCKGAAACWLDNGVLRMLAGSTRWNGKSLEEDMYFGAPSPASTYVLGRSSNGWTEWTNSRHKSMKELRHLTGT